MGTYKNETNSRTNAPEVGASIVLSDKAAGQYQSWTLKYQRFQNIEGPFSFVNPDGLSISTEATAGMPCSPRMDLKGQTHDHSLLSQQFFLGENGHIISAQCPGLVISSTDTGNLSLQTRLRNKLEAKWTLKKDGTIENMKSKQFLSVGPCPSGLAPAGEEGQNCEVCFPPVVLSGHGQTWTRQNVIVGPPLATNQTWIHDWSVSFTEPGYNLTDLLQFNDMIDDGVTTCHPLDPGFNRAFEIFASSFVISDAEDEETCEQAREELRFEGDHPFDVEVCERFRDHMCDQLFTGLDDASFGPPTFESVEYAAVDYQTVDYEAPEYADDPPLVSARLSGMPATTIVDESAQKQLLGLQKVWLDLQDAVLAFESWAAYLNDKTNLKCDMVPENFCAGPICVFNPGKGICFIMALVTMVIQHIVALALQITLQCVNRDFEISTLGPDQAIYGYEYSKATYQDVKALTKWQYESLLKINNVIEVQHTSMREHLQERHLAMEQNIGEDIFDSQNAIGQSIIDAQNANGQLIVDAHNAMSDQHNKMLKWMHDDFPQRICQVYKATGGGCHSAIGPLEEDQGSIPVEFHWPEDQPTLDVRLQQIESSLRIGDRDGAFVSPNTSGTEHNTGGVMDVRVNQTLKLQLDEIGRKTERKVEEMGKKMEREMKETKYAIQQEMKETKDMVKALIDMIQNKL